MLRSRAVYDWKPGNRSRMVRFYRQFIQPGDLCFDLGAHVGNRTRSWRDLGARVISIEPQPRCLDVLNNRFGRDKHVVIVPKAVASTARELTFHINPGSPTISTLRDRSWQEMMAGYEAFLAGRRPALAPLPVQYVDYARWQEKTFETAAFRRQLDYWKGVLAGDLPVLELAACRADVARNLSPDAALERAFLVLSDLRPRARAASVR